jgi:hypothetical protein
MKPIVRSLGWTAAAAILALPVAAADAAPGTLTADERAVVIDLFERSRSELEALVAATPAEAWLTKPAPEKWSVGEVVEHIVLAEEGLIGMTQGMLAGAPADDWEAIATSVPLESLVTQVQDRSTPRQAPEGFVPKGGTRRDELLARYAALRAKTIDWARSVATPVKQHVADTPVGRVNAYHMMAFIAAHNLRHNRQIAEAQAMLAAAKP